MYLGNYLNNALSPYAPIRTPVVGDALAKFWAGGISTKRWTVWGDSTSGPNAVEMWNALNGQIRAPGGELAGLTITNLGINGQTMAGALTNIADLYATNPDLVSLCFGINDVRLGLTTQAQLAASITNAVIQLKTNFPNVCVVLWTPNALQKNDPQAYGYVVPLTSAQAYTDIMRLAYAQLNGLFNDTAYVNKMDATGSVCIDNSPYMQDILHPNNLGQITNLKPLITRITPPVTPINLTASAAAWTSNPLNPWTVYPRALEDTRYVTLQKTLSVGTFVDLGANYLYYFDPRWDLQYPTVQTSDVFPGGFFATTNGNYRFTGAETMSNLDIDSMQIQLPVAGGAPGNTPGLVNGKLYKLV